MDEIGGSKVDGEGWSWIVGHGSEECRQAEWWGEGNVVNTICLGGSSGLDMAQDSTAMVSLFPCANSLDLFRFVYHDMQLLS